MDIREIIDRIYRMPESSAVRLAACMSSLSRPPEEKFIFSDKSN